VADDLTIRISKNSFECRSRVSSSTIDLMTTAREGKVDFRSSHTWYRVVGDTTSRVPLVCVHGGPGSSHNYFGRVEKLADEGRPVVLYDQVGCGNSSRSPAHELDLTVFVDELSNLRTQLGLEEVFLLGTSWGGMVVLAYALARPSGLRGLVLSSTLASSATWTSEAARLRDALPEPHAEALRTGSPGKLAYDAAQEIFDARHVCRVPDTPEMHRMRKARNPEVYRAVWGPNEWTMLGSVGEWDVRRQLRDLDLPVLITAGEHDLCTRAVLDELQEGIPSARTEVFEGTSHMPYLEDPGAYLSVLTRFLNEIDAL